MPDAPYSADEVRVAFGVPEAAFKKLRTRVLDAADSELRDRLYLTEAGVKKIAAALDLPLTEAALLALCPTARPTQLVVLRWRLPNRHILECQPDPLPRAWPKGRVVVLRVKDNSRPEFAPGKKIPARCVGPYQYEVAR